MKLILSLVLLFLISCSSIKKEKDNKIFVQVNLLSGSRIIESGQVITMLSKSSEIEKVKDQGTTRMNLVVEPSSMHNDYDYRVELAGSHNSKKFGDLDLSSKMLVQLNKKSVYEIKNKDQNFTIEVFVSKISNDFESKNKSCMASIYSAQLSYKKQYGKFSSNFKNLERSSSCSHDANITVVATSKSSFVAVGVFSKKIWVTNQDKYLIEIKKED